MADFVNPNVGRFSETECFAEAEEYLWFGEQSVNSTRHVQSYDQATLCSRTNPFARGPQHFMNSAKDRVFFLLLPQLRVHAGLCLPHIYSQKLRAPWNLYLQRSQIMSK
ncbi:hypothetical protein PGT21_010661 [Puccinia graminis f. sp. tritici]|uniref:Uncharacterized protein n=1 Tax=Puccinia graminis f. sp. tritici TaxID=56615 RepID=A0A5B0R0W0_PUCGR|nr:hypothetical protein PGT21_010661 [Puccinia graminis f. sp. tritici]